MLIYRTPDNLDSLRNDPPVWATDSAVRIQTRLLAWLLVNDAELMKFRAFRFPSEMHRRIALGVQDAGGFERWLATHPFTDGIDEVYELVCRISDEWEADDVGREQAVAMMATVEFYWLRQQHCFRSLEQAARAWKGRR